MAYTYVASNNSTGAAETLGEEGKDILVKAIIWGTQTDGKIVRFYNKNRAAGHASGIGSVSSDSLAAHIVQATAAAGKNWERKTEFAGADCPGLKLDGGSFHTDGTNITVLWEPV